jgi:hypothetical protein
LTAQEAAEELTRNALAVDFDPTQFKIPGEDHVRRFNYGGREFRATLTRMKLEKDKYGWLLSMSYCPNKNVRPTAEEGAAIARIFFGSKPWNLVPDYLDPLKWSLKYMLIEEVAS